MVLLRRNRTEEHRSVGAERIERLVEIENRFAVRRARHIYITPHAVGLLAAGSVAEDDEQHVRLVVVDEGVECVGLPVELEREFSDVRKLLRSALRRIHGEFVLAAKRRELRSEE